MPAPDGHWTGVQCGHVLTVTGGIMSFPFDRVRHLLIDLDGVLYRGDMPLDRAAEFVRWLRGRGIAFRLVTNNATLTQAQYATKLRGMSIDVEEREVFTSSLATALYLKRQEASGQTAFVIGEEGLLEALRAVNISAVDHHPDWVVVGLDRHVTYSRLAQAALALQAGAAFVGTNPDLSFPTERGLVPGAGALQAVLIATTGIEPVVIGKPQPLMLELAMQSLGSTAHDTAMLGDRLDTDIRGASSLHMPSILVLTGVSTRDDLQASEDRPTLVVNHLGDLMHLWDA